MNITAASRLSRVGLFSARSRFARSTIPEEKWGLLIVYFPIFDFFWGGGGGGGITKFPISSVQDCSQPRSQVLPYPSLRRVGERTWERGWIVAWLNSIGNSGRGMDLYGCHCNVRVIWLCACVRYWPGHGLVYVCPLL